MTYIEQILNQFVNKVLDNIDRHVVDKGATDIRKREIETAILNKVSLILYRTLGEFFKEGEVIDKNEVEHMYRLLDQRGIGGDAIILHKCAEALYEDGYRHGETVLEEAFDRLSDKSNAGGEMYQEDIDEVLKEMKEEGKI